MIKTVNFISGGGSTNERILKEQAPGKRLNGLVETMAIISNTIKAAGIIKAISCGFNMDNIHVVTKDKGEFENQILDILEKYKPDWFHQLGWIPLMPKNVVSRFKGLNQHLGPGGQYMIGPKRIYAHMRFCEIIGESRPIPIFCQLVANNYDDGDIVFVEFKDIKQGSTVSEIAGILLPVEHEVQIRALEILARGEENFSPVPRVYVNEEEKNIMDKVRLEANRCFHFAEDEAMSHRFMSDNSKHSQFFQV